MDSQGSRFVGTRWKSMNRDNNMAVYHDDYVCLRLFDKDDNLVRTYDLKIRLVAFDVVWGVLRDGTNIEIDFNQSAPKYEIGI